MTGGPPAAWDAVVLAGGRARRMAGEDKLLLDVGGRSMLSRALDAVSGAKTLVVVGPPRAVDVSRELVWCREQPEGSGPAAALRTALSHVTAEHVVVVAGDQPFVDAETVGRLLDAVTSDGAVAVDDSLQPQWLCSAWRTSALRTAALAANESLRVALGSLAWRVVPVETTVALDCDTPQELQRAREIAG